MCDPGIVTVDFREVVYEVEEIVLGAGTMASPSNVVLPSRSASGDKRPLSPSAIVVRPWTTSVDLDCLFTMKGG
jgi:hypothetical protein